MDENMITSLEQVLNDHSNSYIKSRDARRKINVTLRQKSVGTIIKELSTYIETIPKKEKNRVTVITVIALVRRDLDATPEIVQEIRRYGLAGNLYGGLCILFSGRSEQLALNVTLRDADYNNKYEFVQNFRNHELWKHIEIFETVNILYLIEPRNFEELAFKDKTRLLLLHMVHGKFGIVPSDELVTKLLESQDILHKNIGFSFLTTKIVRWSAEADFEKKQTKKRKKNLLGLSTNSMRKLIHVVIISRQI